MIHPRGIPLLSTVHADLQRVILRAADFYPGHFTVTEGERTLEKQRVLFAKGASKTMKSRHLAGCNACSVACAVDLAVWVDLDGDGSIDNGEIRWDWPLYAELARAVKEAARVEGVPIEWGGECFGPKFIDGPHFQLPWSKYP